MENPIQNPELNSIESIENQIIESMENSEIKKEKKIRIYNNPDYKSPNLEDLSSLQFPLIFEKDGKIEKFENRFGDLKKGDIISFKLNPNNKNSFPMGKIEYFKIQSNGFWIKYSSYDGSKYFKNMNLFIGKSSESEIKEFNKKSKEFQKSKESEKK